jgi:two-component system alkaline phosphatase synthesis response regulator PhoP
MNRKVLVIDDQPFMLKLISYNLRKNGFDVATETDGLKALERIGEINPGLVVLDIRMPKITGTDLCARLRADQRFSKTPIIILTSQLREDAEDAAMAAGATDFMTKPFSPTELLAKVESYLEK